MSTIVISKNNISKLFFQYNRQFFENQLLIPAFGILHSKIVYGQFRTKYDKRKKMGYSPQLLISKEIEWTEDGLRDVVVHEMVHLYVWQKTNINRNRHRGLFKKKCDELKKEYGIDVRRPDIIRQEEKSIWETIKYLFTKKHK